MQHTIAFNYFESGAKGPDI